MQKHLLPMKLQLFAKGDGAGEQEGQSGQQSNAEGTQQEGQSGQTFDYEKLASIISGKQNVAEQTVLKNYFKEQGLSKEEAESAIRSFREQKKANEPDVHELQQQIQQARTAANEAVIQKEGILLGIEMGLDAKSVPYVLKLADTSKAIAEDGTVDQEELKKAINQVLEDVPALKPDREEGAGIHKLGSDGSGAGGQGDQSSQIAGIFGN